jgi:hypothetical protein
LNGRVAFVIAAALLCVAPPAGAQSFTRLYISAGVSTAFREAGTTRLYEPEPVVPERAGIPALSLSIGARVHRRLGVEGSLEVQPSQSFPWEWSRAHPQTEQRIATDRDTPLLGYARIITMPSCRNVCVEPVIGGGFTWHHAENRTTAICGNYMATGPCVPVATDYGAYDVNGLEFTFATGADFPIRTSPAFSVAPRFRIATTTRRRLLLNTNHAPDSASGFVMTIGIAATWRR